MFAKANEHRVARHPRYELLLASPQGGEIVLNAGARLCGAVALDRLPDGLATILVAGGSEEGLRAAIFVLAGNARRLHPADRERVHGGLRPLFPIMFLSGTVVPVESMPEVLQILSLASPLRHYMDIVLGIFLKGAGLAELWPQALALLAIGLPLFAVSVLVFRRTLA